jgi:hypothetical protein
MNDAELESLLDDAGYSYDVTSGQFVVRESREVEMYNAQDVADQLEIPIDDMIRWQEEQGHADETPVD